MKATLFAAIATCLVVTTGAVAADESDEGGGPKSIAVDAVAQTRFGVMIAVLKGAAAPTGTASTGRVLDPSTLLQADSELTAAAASFAASRAEVDRTQKLYSEDRTVSRRAVEAAHAQAQADLQKVNAARRQLALEWGGGVADLQAHRRAELIDDLSHARAELVRVEVPAGTPMPRAGSTLEVRGNTPADVFAGSVLGNMPLADPRLQTRGVLVEVKGDATRLPIGQMLSAEVPAAEVAGTDGVVLPRGSLIRRDARVWVYVQTAPTTFVRRRVRDYKPISTGWFVAQGFAPGDRVVAAGAAALLGVESPAPADTDKDKDKD
jgi:hypothetical protein